MKGIQDIKTGRTVLDEVKTALAAAPEAAEALTKLEKAIADIDSGISKADINEAAQGPSTETPAQEVNYAKKIESYRGPRKLFQPAVKPEVPGEVDYGKALSKGV